MFQLAGRQYYRTIFCNIVVALMYAFEKNSGTLKNIFLVAQVLFMSESISSRTYTIISYM